MFPPHPEPFAGAVPASLPAASRLPRQIEVSLAALSLFAGGSAALGAAGFAGAGWPDAVKLAALAMLVPALVGIALMEAAAETPGQSVTRLWSRIARHVAVAEGRAVRGALGEDADEGFAGLVGAMLLRLKRLQVMETAGLEAARAANAALQSVRDEAAGIVTRFRDDGAALTDAASDIMAASARLAGEAAETRTGAAATEASVGRMTDQVVSLAGSVGHVTGQIRRMSEIAATAAGAAFGAQTHLAGLDEKARSFGNTAGQVGRALQMAASCGRVAGAQAEGQDDDGRVAADLAANLQEMASCADQALSDMQSAVKGLLADAAAAGTRLAELSALIESQHALGEALSYAVGQQGEDIGQVLGLLNEAHAGFTVLRAGVDAITASNNARLASAETLRGAVARIPAHADTIARILRGIPDFAPPILY